MMRVCHISGCRLSSKWETRCSSKVRVRPTSNPCPGVGVGVAVGGVKGVKGGGGYRVRRASEDKPQDATGMCSPSSRTASPLWASFLRASLPAVDPCLTLIRTSCLVCLIKFRFLSMMDEVHLVLIVHAKSLRIWTQVPSMEAKTKRQTRSRRPTDEDEPITARLTCSR